MRSPFLHFCESRGSFSIGDFINSESLRIPSYVYGSAWIGHAPFLNWLISEQRPKTFVELGTHLGYSYFTACEAVMIAGLGTRCFAVDLWTGDEHAGFYDENIYRDVKTRNESQYGDFSRLIRSSFSEALSYFGPESIDLLHIDGRHFYEDVREDFESWLPKMNRNSIVLFHDISVRERGFGVHKYWEELKRKYSSFEFQHSNGLGVLCLGNPCTPLLKRLFSLGGDEAATAMIEKAYMRLGSSIDDRRRVLQVRRIEQELEKLQALDERLDAIERAIGLMNSLSNKEPRT